MVQSNAEFPGCLGRLRADRGDRFGSWALENESCSSLCAKAGLYSIFYDFLSIVQLYDSLCDRSIDAEIYIEVTFRNEELAYMKHQTLSSFTFSISIKPPGISSTAALKDFHHSETKH